MNDELVSTSEAPMRVELCVCGDYIVAEMRWSVVAAAIRLHNLQERHQAWRRWRYFADPRPTPDRPTGDVSRPADGLSVGASA